MVAGVKITNASGQIIIDQNYSNFLMVGKLALASGWESVQTIPLGAPYTQDVGASSLYIYDITNFVNSTGAVSFAVSTDYLWGAVRVWNAGTRVKLGLYCTAAPNHPKPTYLYGFRAGAPNIPISGPGFKVYKNNGEVAFDSRYGYMKVVKTLEQYIPNSNPHNGGKTEMYADVSKKYALLITKPIKIVECIDDGYDNYYSCVAIGSVFERPSALAGKKIISVAYPMWSQRHEHFLEPKKNAQGFWTYRSSGFSAVASYNFYLGNEDQWIDTTANRFTILDVTDL